MKLLTTLHRVQHDNNSSCWCGPAVLSAISGRWTTDCHAALREAGGRRAIRGVFHSELIVAARLFGYRLRDVNIGKNLSLATFRETDEVLDILTQDGILIVSAGCHYQIIKGDGYLDSATRSLRSFEKTPRAKYYSTKIVTRAWVVEIIPSCPEWKPARKVSQ